MTMKLSARGLSFIKGFESFVPYVYDDLLPPVKGRYREWDGGPVRGTLTIGYGHTDAAQHPLKMKQGLRITEAEGRKILDVDLDDVEAHVNRVVKVEITQGMFDALVSLSFNLGPLDVKAKTLLNRLNAGDYDGARRAFDLYVRSKGEVLRGLQRRRDGEQVLWDDDAPAGLAPGEFVHHPAEVDAVNPPPMATSKEGGTILAVGSTDTIHTVNETVNAVAEIKKNATEAGLGEILVSLTQNPKVLVGVSILAGCVALYWFRWRKRRMEAHVRD